MGATRLFALLLICSTTLSTAHAQVLMPLTGGKKVKFRDTSVPGRDSAKVEARIEEQSYPDLRMCLFELPPQRLDGDPHTG